MLLKLTYVGERNKFFSLIDQHRQDVEKIVAYHLSLGSPKRCHVAGAEHWIHGSFNVCIPVRVDGQQRRVMVRLPLPYRVGERVCPGNADEKVRCEAGAYAWLQQNCPSVPIPFLHGFGLSNTLHVRGTASQIYAFVVRFLRLIMVFTQYTSMRNLPFLSRWIQTLRRAWLSLWRCRRPSDYMPYRTQGLQNPFGPYMVIDYIEESEGQMLSETWDENRDDPKRRANLFGGISRLILRLSHIPLPKIGSFTIDDRGFLTLATRPLTFMIQELEIAGFSMHIARERTHTSVISYISDLLTYHDNRLRHDRNAVNGVGDCVSQMCALAIMRAVAPRFYSHDLDAGPFAFSLTDLHQSNIFVDRDWNITCIIDLEWAASLEFIQLPHWLNGQHVDVIETETYNPLREEFMDIFRREASEFNETAGLQKVPAAELFSIMENTWNVGTFWFNLALRNPPAMHSLFYDRVQSQFVDNHLRDQDFYRIVGFYWCRDTKSFVGAKLREKKDYDKQLREEFQVDD